MIHLQEDGDLWVRRFHPSPAASAKLVCLPYAGGSAGLYLPLSQCLTPDIEVLAVQYPGRQDRFREPALTSLDELACAVFESLRAHRGRPMALFGHSMGALLAFEVALRLEDAGTPALALFASGCGAPSRRRDEAFHDLSDDRLLAALRALAGADGGLPADDRLLRMALPVIRADSQAVATRHPRPDSSLAAPIHVFTGRDDASVTAEDAHAWAGHTTSACTVRAFPGGHFFLGPQQDAVAEAIRVLLPSS